MGLLQKTASRALVQGALTGNAATGMRGRLLWTLANRTPEQLLPELRSSLENPQTPLSFPAEWLLDIFNGGRTDSGIRVSEMTALQADVVLACVSIITKGISSLPLHIFERQVRDGRNAKRLAVDHKLYDMMHLLPNEEMTMRTYLAVAMCHALLWGNSYTELQRNKAAQVVALWPRNPARTRPVRLTKEASIEGTLYPPGTLVYHTSETQGDEISFQDDAQNAMAPERLILAEDMLHVPGLSLDGRLGQSTIYLARQSVGLSLATEKYGAKFFGNGAVPRGILEIPGVLEPKALENLRRSWQEAHGGENSHRTAVLEQGVKYTAIGLEPEKSQFLETREFQRRAIASVFQVPAHMLGESSSGKSTVEQTSIEFLNYCLNPWLVSFEMEFKRKLFAPDSKDSAYFAKFDTNRLLYPDSESRSKYYTGGKNSGWLNSNDIREHEDMNPIEDGSGDIFWMPINMQDAANPLTAPHIGGKQNIAGAQEAENPLGGAKKNQGKNLTPPAAVPAPQSPRALITHYTRTFYPMFKDAAGRIMNRKEVDETDFKRCFHPVLHAVIESLAADLAPASAVAFPASEFELQVEAYLEGMRFNMQDVTPQMNGTYAMSEVRRAAETFIEIVGQRYNPDHSKQPRHPDGKFHDGKKPFFIGRHGTTDDDVNGLWTGWNPTKLNEQGEKEILDTIEKLRDQGIKRIISSELPRAKYSAQRIATGLGIPMTTDWRLNALNLGELAGLNEKENADKLRFYIDNPDVPIPGGESINSYVSRTQSAIREHRATNEDTGPILDETHSSAVGSYVGCIRGNDNLENCSALLSPAGVLRFDGKKITVIAGKLDEGDAA